MTIARVSNLEAFRRWREDEEQSLEDLIRYITVDDPTPAMLAGTAFHKALETAECGTHDTLKANGYTFHLTGGDIELPSIREMRGDRDYGGLIVSGQVDAIIGKTVIDHKTTSKFDAERYLAGYQWRFYLDIFGGDVFRWNVFEIREVAPNEYTVAEPQTLSANRYPEMHDDCSALAGEYLAFARNHLQPPAPQRDQRPPDNAYLNAFRAG